MDRGTHRPFAYLGLVAVLTVPIWILGLAVKIELLPGLPLAALAVVCPALAASILSFGQGGGRQLRQLLARAFDARKASWRLLLVALINPVLFGLAFLLSRAFGASIPDPQFAAPGALLLLVLFLPTALLEELGWSAYALDDLQARYGPRVAGVLLGLVWAAWHIPALVEQGRPAEWIAWWCLWTVSARIIMVTVYNRTGASVFAVALYHAMSNLCWQLYPVQGSFFDPRISGLVTFALAAAVLLLRPRAAAGVANAA
jgi:membrane protease YdiL (CAAX protease family)